MDQLPDTALRPSRTASSRRTPCTRSSSRRHSSSRLSSTLWIRADDAGTDDAAADVLARRRA
eukprot:6380121-Prymnesium_polylepis.1